jgi:hypothetical protein
LLPKAIVPTGLDIAHRGKLSSKDIITAMALLSIRSLLLHLDLRVSMISTILDDATLES